MLAAKRIAALTIMASLAACGEGGSALARPDNLGCAAHISATSFAIADGEIEVEEAYANEAYFAMMWHLNSWAVPAGISEAEAFDRVKQEAAKLREGNSAEQLLETSRWCITNRPQQ